MAVEPETPHPLHAPSVAAAGDERRASTSTAVAVPATVAPATPGSRPPPPPPPGRRATPIAQEAAAAGSPATAALPATDAVATPATEVDAATALAAWRGEAWIDLVGVLDREIAAESAPALRALLRHEMGELVEFHIGEEGAAVSAYGGAFKDAPRLRPNLWALRRICRRKGMWSNLLRIIDTELQLVKSGPERAELLVERGQILEDKQDDAAGAGAAFAKAADADPNNLVALMALERTAARAGAPASLAEVYRRLADATSEPGRKVALLLDLARLQRQLAPSAGEAATRAGALFREAYELGVDRMSVVREMERQCEEGGDATGLLQALDLRVAILGESLAQLPAATSALHEEARERLRETIAAVHRRQAVVAEQAETKGAEAAWRAPYEYLTRAVALLPEEPLLVADLADLAERHQRWPELVVQLRRQLTSGAADLRPLRLLYLARALRRAGEAAEADSVEGELAGLVTGEDALPLLFDRQRRALAAGDHAALAARALEEATIALAIEPRAEPVGVGPGATWAASALTSAGAAFERAGDHAAAISAYRGALDAQPDHQCAFAALDRLLTRAGRHAERDGLYSARLESAAADERVAILDELLEIRADLLAEPARAIDLVEELCRLRPEDAAHRLRAIDVASAAGRFDLVAALMEQLAAILAAQGNHDRAIELRVMRAGVLERRLGQTDGALEALAEVVAAVPGHALAAAEHARLLRATGRADALAAALERELEATLDGTRAERLLIELGELYERGLKRDDQATAVYERLLARLPGHPAALRGLSRIYERTNDLDRLCGLVERMAESAAAPDAQALHWMRLAELQERAGRDEAAETAWALAASASAGLGLAAHAAVGRLQAAIRLRNPLLYDAALEQLAVAAGASVHGEVAEERAWWLGEQSGDAQAAEERLRDAADDSIVVIWARRRFAARRGDGSGLGDALSALAQRIDDPPLRAALSLRAAVHAAANGRDARPRITAASAAGGDAYAWLASELADEPAALARRADLAAPEDLAEWTLEVADALAARGRLREAGLAITRGLAAAPQHLGLLDCARRLARAAGDRRGQALASAHLARAISDRDRAAELLEEAAQLLELVEDSEQALVAWRGVLALRPTDLAAYERARELLRTLEDPPTLEEVLSQQIDQVTDPARRIAALLERAEMRARTRRRRAALRDYRAVLEIDPRHGEALRSLSTLLVEAGDLAAAAAALGRFIAGADDPIAARAAHLELAALLQQLGRRGEAIVSLEQAIAAAPEDVAALEQLAELHLADGNPKAAIERLGARARLASEPHQRAAIELRVAVLYQDSLDDQRAAREALSRALDADPLHLDALARLVSTADAPGESALRGAVLTQAASEALARIAVETPRLATFRALERVFEWQGDDDSRARAAQAAALVAGEVPPTRDGVADPHRELSPGSWERAMPPEVRSAAIEIWREVHEAGNRLLGPDLGGVGVERSDRQNAKGIPVAWIPVDRIARALGVGAYDLYRSPQGRDVARVIGSALVLGSAHADKLSPAARFRVARKLALLRERMGPLEQVPITDLELFFAGCARIAGAQWRPAGALTEARIEESAKAIGKIIDRKTRKALIALASRFATIGDLATWREAILVGATRLGLAIGGDVAAAFAELQLGIDSGAGVALARFAVSPDLAAIRRDLGLGS